MDQSSKINEEKLQDEARALSFSWKTARFGLYAAFGLGASAGLSQAVPAVLAGNNEELAGAAVDAITLLAALAGAAIDSQSRPPSAKPASAAITLPDWGDALGLSVNLQVSDSETKTAALGPLLSKARQTVVLLVGPKEWIKEVLIAARCDAALFRTSDVLLVPFATGVDGSESSKGFGSKSSWADAPFVAEPASPDFQAWADRVDVEVNACLEQGGDSSQGLVVVLGQGGAVAERRLGTPDWRPFLVRLRPERFDEAEVRRVTG